MLRLFAGILKGLFVGSLVGFLLVALGLGVPGPLVAYLAAAASAALVAPIAGKKIWEKDGPLQAGLKALTGLLLGPGVMWVVRRFVGVPLPDVASWPGVGRLPGVEALRGVPLSLGTFSVTSIALVTALIAGFFDADNTPTAGTSAKPPRSPKANGGRIDPELAALTGLDAAELEGAADDAEPRRTKR